MIDPVTAVHLERGAAHLHELGKRAIAEFLIEIGDRTGETLFVVNLLTEYRRRLTPEMLAALGGDRFPPRIRAVP
jgi:hypothetical protein